MFALHHLRLLLLAIAFVLAGALAWRAWQGPVVLPREPERPFARGERPTQEALNDERDAVVRRLSDAPAFAAFVDQLSSAFPRDWDRMLTVFARRGLPAHALDAPEVYVSDALRMLRRDRGVTAGKASADALARVFEAQAALLSGLAASDKRLCVDFLLGQTSPAFMAFIAAHRDLLANLATASLSAMREGETKQVDRPAPSDADFDALEAALKARGLGAPEIGALLDGQLPQPAIPDATLCDAGLVYFDALKGLPDDARMRIYALAIRAMAKS